MSNKEKLKIEILENNEPKFRLWRVVYGKDKLYPVVCKWDEGRFDTIYTVERYIRTNFPELFMTREYYKNL